jgi:hypothetical protein
MPPPPPPAPLVATLPALAPPADSPAPLAPPSALAPPPPELGAPATELPPALVFAEPASDLALQPSANAQHATATATAEPRVTQKLVLAILVECPGIANIAWFLGCFYNAELSVTAVRRPLTA